MWWQECVLSLRAVLTRFQSIFQNCPWSLKMCERRKRCTEWKYKKSLNRLALIPGQLWHMWGLHYWHKSSGLIVMSKFTLVFFFSCFCKGDASVNESLSSWKAGWVYKTFHQPSSHKFGGHFPLRSVTDAHAVRSVSCSILIVHVWRLRKAKTALRHEVLRSSAPLPVLGVSWVFSCHHRGKWRHLGS